MEKRHDVETLLINRVLNIEYFHGRFVEKISTKSYSFVPNCWTSQINYTKGKIIKIS